MSNYLGDHFGKIIWSKYAISKDYMWYDLNANKSEQSVFGKWMEESGNFQFFGKFSWELADISEQPMDGRLQR